VKALAEARRAFELARFDHMAMVNEINTCKRLELVEFACAAFLSFVTYFHSGGYAADTLKHGIDRISEQLSVKRPIYSMTLRQTQVQRRKLEGELSGDAKALDFRVASVFPREKPNMGIADHEIPPEGKKVHTDKKIEKEGYLRKLSSSMKKDWKRRWFSLQGGQLFYVRSSKDLSPVHVVNALLCTVRPNHKTELELCFDLISPNKRVYTLQAESESDYKEWIDTFAASTESLMTDMSSPSGRSSSEKTRDHLQKETLVSKIKSENPRCAECDAPDPDWCVINHGVVICIECSGIHRSLGVHISKVRSLTLDTWSTELLDLISHIGNTKFNALYEHSMPSDYRKPSPDSNRDAKEEFIRLKYVTHAFVSKLVLGRASSPEIQLHEFHAAVAKEDLAGMMEALAMRVNINQGADDDLTESRQESSSSISSNSNTSSSEFAALPSASPPSSSPEPFSPSETTAVVVGTTALHVAARFDRILAAEYLLQNGAKTEVLDKQGRTPLAVATEHGSKRVDHRLQKKLP